MKLSGEATLNASVDQVYAALIDPAVLVRTIPGCQKLEQVAPDEYRATIVAGIAAIKGTFDGEVRLTDQDAPHAFTLHASGVGAPGTVSATARVSLTPADATSTRLTYEADAAIGGVIGGVGQRMITGVARKTAGEFFAAVDQALSGPSAVAATASAMAPRTPVTVDPAPTGLVWTAPAATPDPGRQRVRDLVTGAVFGAAVALLGVLVGALIVAWK